MKIRQIVFDMGNVIVPFRPEAFMDREGILDPADRKTILQEMFLSKEWAKMDLGVLTEETAEPEILKRIPERLRPQAHRLLFHWADGRECVPGMEALVERLRNSGYGIYMLSNASVAQHSYWPTYRVSRLFDQVFLSCDVGLVKPDPAIYKAFTDKYGLNPGECLFIDDLPANAAAAECSGWSAIVFHGDAGKLTRELEEKGIL